MVFSRRGVRQSTCLKMVTAIGVKYHHGITELELNMEANSSS
jgi:hypothetical protein